jgi:acetylornithine deacetylase/succinyl-diaminopimelate desuccinylase-like protein
MVDCVRIASQLVRIPSVNPMGGVEGLGSAGRTGFTAEGRLTDYLSDLFHEIGIPSIRQTVSPGRENIVALFMQRGARRTILFDAHQDTVSAAGMTIEPFGGEVRGGKLLGRGACDVKGGMAAMIAAAARVASEKPRTAASVALACTVDEEHSFQGVRRLLSGPWERGTPDMAVVAEPTRLEVVIAHKGFMRWKIATRGRSCHSASPQLGINAIYKMAAVVQALEEYARGLENGRCHPLLGTPTVNVGTISGGSGANTVPSSCIVEIDRRLIPGEDPAAAFADCRAGLLARLGVDFPLSFQEPWHAEPVLDTPADSEVARVSTAAVSSVLGSASAVGVPYGTDASTISAGGIPAVVLGPGDIAQAHTPDEWVETDQIEKAAEVYYRLILLAGEIS